MKKDYIQGVKSALPIILGYIPIGFAFGVLAVQQGLSILEIGCMSILVYAGSAQFIGAAMIASGTTTASIVMTTFLVNLRHLLMSASYSPYLKHIASPIQALIAYGITDETYAVGIVHAEETTHANTKPVSANFFLGLHITSQASWVVSTVLGGVLGNLIPDPARWGIDFALSAMFIGLLLMQIKDKKDILVAVCAGGLSLLLATGTSGHWNIIIAALTAATIGVSIELWTKKLFLYS